MTKPTLEDIEIYCQYHHPSVDPVAFFLHYETNGWMVGKVPMKNWKAGIANWDRMQQTRNGGNGHAKLQTFAQNDATATIEAARKIREEARSRLRSLGIPREDTRVQQLPEHAGSLFERESLPVRLLRGERDKGM